MTRFQIIILGIFVLFIIVGAATFALYRGGSSSNSLPTVVIWGTFPKDTFDQYVSKINISLPQPISVDYVQKSPAAFSGDFIAALARGTGPDGILIPSDMLLPHFDKLALIPYEALPQRNFRDIYIQEGEMYLTENGILGLPFTVDPLIMYWNRDIFSAAGLATYPRYWDEFSSLNRRLTAKDQNGNIRRSAVAMGEFTNVENAREIFGTLLLQLGNPVVIRTADGGFESAISVRAPVDPAPAIEFFTSFVDPSNPDYSWNRGLPSSKSAFLSGMLATYFGFSSELSDIRAKNPNLNFDAAPLPQLRAGGQKATYGRMYGFSIIRSSSNPNAVYQIVSLLSSPSYLSELSNSLYMPSVRRDLIAAGSGDPYISVFNEAALVSKSWFDAGPEASRQVFGTMIEAVTSGKKSVFEAVQDAGDRYDIILRQATQ